MKSWLNRDTVSTTVGVVEVMGVAAALDQEYEVVPVDRIRPHPENPRHGNLGAIRESIRANGFYGACLVQLSTGHILVGNHRYIAATQEGLTEVPVVWTDVDDATALRIMLADNRTNDLATYDDSILIDLLTAVARNDDLVGSGYTDADIEALLNDVDTTDELDPDAPSFDLSMLPDVTIADPKVLPESGTKWRIGPHLLVVVNDMMEDWQLWTDELGEGDWFVPYPGPFVPLVAPPAPRLVMVQPNRYMAGHLLEKWASVHDDATVVEA